MRLRIHIACRILLNVSLTELFVSNPLHLMVALRLSLVVLMSLLAGANLRAVTPALKSVVTIQGVISYTAPQAPKTLTASTNLVEYKATQTALRFTTADLVQAIIGTSNPTEIKKWTLVGVRNIAPLGVNLDYTFYLVNTDKTIAPLAVSSSILSTSLYGFAESYTERWQGFGDSAVPVSGTGSFKFMAGADLSLEDGGYSITATLTGPATGSYKVASALFGSEKHVTYVPGTIKMTTSGVVTLSDGNTSLPCVGEFTFTAAASQPIDLDKFLNPTSGSGNPPNDGGGGVVTIVSPSSP